MSEEVIRAHFKGSCKARVEEGDGNTVDSIRNFYYLVADVDGCLKFKYKDEDYSIKVERIIHIIGVQDSYREAYVKLSECSRSDILEKIKNYFKGLMKSMIKDVRLEEAKNKMKEINEEFALDFSFDLDLNKD